MKANNPLAYVMTTDPLALAGGAYSTAVVSDALEMFWSGIAAAFPAVRTGDLPPDTADALERAAEAAVAEWLRLNLPRR